MDMSASLLQECSVADHRDSSTPNHANIITKTASKGDFNFPSPLPHVTSSIATTTKTTTLVTNGSNTDKQQEVKQHNTSGSAHYRRIVIKENNEQIEAEIKIREKVSQQLKSIDLSKYAFANEFKPKTDYTYARTGIYLSSKVNENENVEMPNLCRRSRKPTPENSFNLSSASSSSGKHTFLESINLFKLLKSSFYRKNANHNNTSTTNRSVFDNDTTSNVQRAAATTTIAESNEKGFYLSNLYGLDANHRTNASSRSSAVTSQFYNSVHNHSTSLNDTNTSTTIDTHDISQFVQRENIRKRSKFLRCCSLMKWLLLLPLLLFLAYTFVPEQVYNYKYDDLISFDNLNSYVDSFNRQLKNVQTQLSAYNRNPDADTCRQELEEMRSAIRRLEQSIYLISSERSVSSENITNDLRQEIAYILKTNITELTHNLKNLIKRDIYRYNADKTGMTDYASESLGASIMFTRCTETYVEKARWLTVWTLPVMPIYNTPRTIIQNDVHPGNCYAFKGHKADIFIKLAATIVVTSFSLEHIPIELSPSNLLDTAPKNFSVYGYESEEQIDLNEGVHLGSYAYDNTTYDFIQFFDVQHETKTPISIIELKIESNGGNKEYTCIYKFRVHGIMMRNVEL